VIFVEGGSMSKAHYMVGWPRLSSALLLTLITVAAFFLWPTVQRKLLGDLQMMSSGQDAAATEVIGSTDWICFDRGRYQEEFMSESRRLGEPFTRSLEQCGVDHSCCNSDSNIGGVIGLVKDGQIRCVENVDFDVYPKLGPVCVKPTDVIISRKNVASGTEVPGRPWVTRASRATFEIVDRSPKRN
jgi:hypothetical protein